MCTPRPPGLSASRPHARFGARSTPHRPRPIRVPGPHPCHPPWLGPGPRVAATASQRARPGGRGPLGQGCTRSSQALSRQRLLRKQWRPPLTGCSPHSAPSRATETHLRAHHQLRDAVHHRHSGRGQRHLLLPVLALQPAEAKGPLSLLRAGSASTVPALTRAAAGADSHPAGDGCKQTGKLMKTPNAVTRTKLWLAVNRRSHKSRPWTVTVQNSAHGPDHLLRVGSWPRGRRGWDGCPGCLRPRH